MNNKSKYEKFCNMVASGKLVSNITYFINGQYTVEITSKNDAIDIFELCYENRVEVHEAVKNIILDQLENHSVLVSVENKKLNSELKEYSEIIMFDSLYSASRLIDTRKKRSKFRK